MNMLGSLGELPAGFPEAWSSVGSQVLAIVADERRVAESLAPEATLDSQYHNHQWVT